MSPAALTATIADTTTPTVFVNLQEVDARVGRVPLVLATPARAAWRGDVLSVDALDLAGGPLAKVHLSHCVPAGFHGTWRPGD